MRDLKRPSRGALAAVARLRSGANEARRPVDDTWAERRGEDHYRGAYDAIGNFPGFAGNAALIVNGALALTERFLLVDEWAPHGFAIPLAEIIDVSIDADPDTFEDILVRYHTDDGAMLIRFRATRSRLPGRSRTKPADMMGAFASVGLTIADYARTVNEVYSVSWDSLHLADSDSVVWKGRITAPLRPSRECAPTDVWITPGAILWGSSRNRGVNRVPLSAVQRLAVTSLHDGTGTPTVYVRVGPVGDTTLDLPFIFNLAASGGSPAETRAEFLAIFRDDAVVEIEATASTQPWVRPSGEMPVTDEGEAEDLDEAPDDEGVERSGERESTLVSIGDEPDAVPEEPAVPEPDLQFETWADVSKPTSFPYGPDQFTATRRIDADLTPADFAFDSSGTRLADALTSWPGAPGHREEAPAPPEPITEPKMLLRYLATARHSIDEVNDAIDRRVANRAAPVLRTLPPSSEQQSQALAELIELAGTDYYSVEQARRVKAEVTALGEASNRLRSLIELCNAGHLTIMEASTRRDAIMLSLPRTEDVE